MGNINNSTLRTVLHPRCTVFSLQGTDISERQTELSLIKPELSEEQTDEAE
ncbi:MAG: hypothetical protein HYZ34_07570 [Ignavibacteriae bacterium]|nr:hypothetical protein [Ignavibacteriota bacterium]